MGTSFAHAISSSKKQSKMSPDHTSSTDSDHILFGGIFENFAFVWAYIPVQHTDFNT